MPSVLEESRLGESRLPERQAPSEKGNYVYVLQCRDGSLYTGWTTDLPARLSAHNGEKGCGAKCTRSRRPVRLVYYEEYDAKTEAMSREAAIKKLSRAEKLKLIGGGEQEAVGRRLGKDALC